VKPVTKTNPLRQALTALASLRITVVLFVLAIILVLLGTLAQVDEGIWTVQRKYFRAGIAWIPLQVFVVFAQRFFGLAPSASIEGTFPYPGGWLLGGLLLANLLAAHLVRFKLSWKRSGILLIHAGLIILMVSELITGLFAVEWHMIIDEDHSANYAEDQRSTELAIIDPSDPEEDKVVVVPATLLKKKGNVIRDTTLPFDVRVERFMVNSTYPQPVKDGEDNPATAGDGRFQAVSEKPEASGVSSELDISAAYLTFLEKGSDKRLGTYLLTVYWSLGADRAQKVPVGDKTYDVSLRFKRAYKPYTLHLLEFRHDKYLGTNIPKNYSSRVRLVDARHKEDREVVISMNNPFRYGGRYTPLDVDETLYQGDFLRKGSELRKGTILQVVHNPGWLIPYISCGLVSFGMLIHFGLHLVGFLRRRLAS
jgi:hypothetical protein